MSQHMVTAILFIIIKIWKDLYVQQYIMLHYRFCCFYRSKLVNLIIWQLHITEPNFYG